MVGYIHRGVEGQTVEDFNMGPYKRKIFTKNEIDNTLLTFNSCPRLTASTGCGILVEVKRALNPKTSRYATGLFTSFLPVATWQTGGTASQLAHNQPKLGSIPRSAMWKTCQRVYKAGLITLALV